MSSVLVLGGGVAGLAAALDLAKVGVEVRIAPCQNWVPLTEVRDPQGTVAALLGELEAPIAPGGHGEPEAAAQFTEPPVTQLRGKNGEWGPQPRPDVFGIPAVPLASDCMRLLGTSGALRAYGDRLKPVLTIGQQENLGKLVDTRMGSLARELLVEPFIHERFGVAAADAEVSIIAPGLNEGLSRVGSLSGGVFQHLERHVARETVVTPLGGWERFVELLFERLEAYGAQQLTESVVRLAAKSDNAGWFALDEAEQQQHYDAVISDPDSLARLFDGMVDDGMVDDEAGQSEAAANEAAVNEAATPPALGEFVAALQPRRIRAYAHTGIQAPQDVSAGDGEGTALRLVTLASGEVWSVRMRQLDAGRWQAELFGPAIAASSGTPHPSIVEEVLRAAQLARTELEPFATAVKPEHAGEAVFHTLTAPFATDAQRNESEIALAAWEAARSDALACGEALHGGDLSAALAEVRTRAVRLRRQLAGIAD